MPARSTVPLLFAAALLVAAASAPLAAPVVGHAPPPPKVTFPVATDVVDVPFKVEGNHILLTARIGDSPDVPCVLDTGARGTVLFGDSLLRTMGLEPRGTAVIRGAGGGGASVNGAIYPDMKIAIGDLVMSNALLVALPEASLPLAPLRHRLVVGHGLFESAVVEIDWAAQRLRFHDPARFRYEGDGATLPLTFDRMGMAYTTAKVALGDGEPFDVKLVVDTGASHALSLEPGTDPRIRAPADGRRVRIGRGAGGEIYGVRGRARTLALGSLELHDVPTDFPDASLGMDDSVGREGSLGGGLLRRFKVFFDFAGSRMILEPVVRIDDPWETPAR